MYDIFERLLKERGVSVADVCRATGIRQSTMSNWKNRRNRLSAKNAELVADYFGISVDELMGRPKPFVIQRPNYEALEKIAIDDDESYYEYKETKGIAQEIFDDQELHALFDAARGSKPEDLRMARDLLKRLKETNKDG